MSGIKPFRIDNGKAQELAGSADLESPPYVRIRGK
jgi:hypothetical protein